MKYVERRIDYLWSEFIIAQLSKLRTSHSLFAYEIFFVPSYVVG
jgi:hypothetical protein